MPAPGTGQERCQRVLLRTLTVSPTDLEPSTAGDASVDGTVGHARHERDMALGRYHAEQPCFPSVLSMDGSASGTFNRRCDVTPGPTCSSTEPPVRSDPSNRRCYTSQMDTGTTPLRQVSCTVLSCRHTVFNRSRTGPRFRSRHELP